MDVSSAYFNTTNLSGGALKSARQNAENQNEYLTKFFRENCYIAFTPCQVWRLTGERFLLTSVRRSINTLTKSGVIKKTGKKVVGVFGHPVNTWKWNGNS